MEGINERTYGVGSFDYSRYLKTTNTIKTLETPVNTDTWRTCNEDSNRSFLMKRYQPIAQLSNPEMSKINDEIKISAEGAIRDFYSGKTSEEELLSKFQALAEKNFKANHDYVNHGLTSKEMDQAMMDTFYGEFRRMALDVAVKMNNDEGKQYVTGNAGSGDWKYYNSDYYYKSEAAIGVLTQGMTELAKEHGHETFQIPDYKEKELWLYNNFNSAFSNPMVASEQTFLDRDLLPPEGFVWFSQQGVSDTSKVVAVLVEDCETPTKFDANNFLTATSWATLRGSDGIVHKIGSDIIYDYSNKDKYILSELFRFDGHSQEASIANDFLSHLQVYRRGYSSEQYSNHRFETLA